MKILPKKFSRLAVAMLIALGVSAPAWADPVPAPAKPRVLGPMTGLVTMRSARLWAQWLPVAEERPVQMQVEYWLDDAPDSRKLGEMLVAGKDTDWVAHWQLSDLEPGKRYRYRVLWRDGTAHGISQSASFTSETLWQWRQDPPPLRVLAGSCAYTNDAEYDRPGRPYGQDTAIFRAMANQKPNLTLWMGDNIYFREADFDDAIGMGERYDKWRQLPDLQPLLRIGSHLAVWDDHDYGPNDSNSSYNFKDVSLKLFERYWVNPSYGLPGLPGVFTRASMADAEFFLLDDRWYRDYDHLVTPDKAMFGDAQMRWLRNALMQSTATWKIIVSGSQIFNEKDRYEGWNNFTRERDGFVNWLTRQKVPGVLFLSGDRHFAAMLKLERSGTYPLYEVTCSPLTSHPYQDPSREVVGNSMMVDGTVMTKNNFCQLDIRGKRGQRELTIQVMDAKGNSAWTRTLKESDLK